MANDYKAASPPRASSARSGGGRSMNPMFLGVIIGLLLGIVLALGIAIWLNRSSSPFQEKAKPVDALPTIAARPGVLQAPNTGAKDGSEKPRFEFYDILPGEKGVKADKGGAHEKVLQPATKPIDATAKSTQDPKREAPVAHPVAKESYLLQAGAFQNEGDAENLKAQIAFAGMEASVRSVNLPDKGTLYRVRLGPYKSLEEVNRIKAALSQNGINAAVVKAE